MLTNLRRLLDRQREHTLATATLVTFTLIFFAPLARGKTFSIVGAHMFAQYPWTAIVKNDPQIVGRGYPQTDQAETFYPASVFATNAVRSGQLPMWLPYSFSGIPIMEVGIGTGLLYPPKLGAMLFLSPIRLHDFIVFTHLLLSALGMYALLRCMGAAAFGAIFGGIVWELSGHSALWLVFEHAAIGAAFLPLTLLAATLAIRKKSFLWAVTAGAALGLSVLSGILNHVYLAILLLICWYFALTVRAIYRVGIRGDRKKVLEIICLPLVSGIVALSLGAATWLAMFDLLPNVHREPETLQSQIGDSISLATFARSVIRPESASGPAGKRPDTGGLAFTGWPALALALLALLRPSKQVMLALLVCVFSIGFALGVQPLMIALRSLLPYIGSIHTYTGWYPFCFAIALLAAFGFTEAGKRLAGFGMRISVLVGLGCLVLAVEAWQLISYAWTVNPLQPATTEWLFPETPFITTLRGLQGQYHVLPVSLHLPQGQWTPPVLAGKVAASFELRSSSGYESLLPLPTAAIWHTVEEGGTLAQEVPMIYRPYFYHDRLPISLLEKLSVGFLATPPNTTPRDSNGRDVVREGALKLVYRGSDGWIYEIVNARPRAFLVPRVVAAPDPPASLAMLADEKFDAARSAVVVGDQRTDLSALIPDSGQAADFTAEASIISDRVNAVEIDAETPRSAMMVLNDSWDAGWRAYIDGVQKPVLRVNYAFRGVIVPEGKHRIIFSYRPQMLLIGLAVSALSLLLLVLLYAAIGVRMLRRPFTERAQTLDSLR